MDEQNNDTQLRQCQLAGGRYNEVMDGHLSGWSGRYQGPFKWPARTTIARAAGARPPTCGPAGTGVYCK